MKLSLLHRERSASAGKMWIKVRGPSASAFTAVMKPGGSSSNRKFQPQILKKISRANPFYSLATDLYLIFLLLWVCACSVTSVMSDSVWSPWTVVCRVPEFMGFSRQEYWSGLPLSLLNISTSHLNRPPASHLLSPLLFDIWPPSATWSSLLHVTVTPNLQL